MLASDYRFTQWYVYIRSRGLFATQFILVKAITLNYVIHQAVVALCVSCKAGRLAVSQCTLQHNHSMHFHDSKAWKALLLISYHTNASGQPQVYYVLMLKLCS